MEDKDKKELTGQIRRKRLKKYALAALAIVIAISIFTGIRLENKDSKLADGQGNVVDYIAENNDDGTNTVVSDENDRNALTDTKKEDGTEEKTKKEDNTGKKSDEEEKKAELTPEKTAVDNSDDFTASNEGNVALKPDKAQPVTVSIEIRCDTLSNDMSKLENESIREYIPDDGVILPETTYHGTTENTVFDVLKTVCRNSDIQLEFSYTPIYESYYIEGINYLYEFDGGSLSGWMYHVNGWYPNYGCSSYYLKNGDKIVWNYSCDMGKDIGAEA